MSCSWTLENDTDTRTNGQHYTAAVRRPTNQVSEWQGGRGSRRTRPTCYAHPRENVRITSRACPATSPSTLPRAYLIGRPTVGCGVVLPVCPCVGVVLQSPRRPKHDAHDLLRTSSPGCHEYATRMLRGNVRGVATGGVYRYIYPQNQSTLQIFIRLQVVLFICGTLTCFNFEIGMTS